MWPYPIHIRSFAPFKTFGGGFGGDNRSYSTTLGKSEIGSNGVTSRVQQSLTVDPNKGTYSGLNTWSDPSHHPVLGEATAEARGTISNFNSSTDKNGNSVTSFTSTMASGNPLVTLSPDVDVTTDFTLIENIKAGTLDVT